jgi:hypothetical protein
MMCFRIVGGIEAILFPSHRSKAPTIVEHHGQPSEHGCELGKISSLHRAKKSQLRGGTVSSIVSVNADELHVATSGHQQCPEKSHGAFYLLCNNKVLKK